MLNAYDCKYKFIVIKSQSFFALVFHFLHNRFLSEKSASLKKGKYCNSLRNRFLIKYRKLSTTERRRVFNARARLSVVGNFVKNIFQSSRAVAGSAKRFLDDTNRIELDL